MGKGKLAKFADMEKYDNVFQYPYSVIDEVPFTMKGRWHQDYFHNQNPIVLELGCGKGEYTVGLAKLYPQMNFIGVDIKGARMWTGATQALREGLKNVAFLRTNIEIIERFFDTDEVQEIWLTFSDPQMKNPRKRLTSTFFLQRYRQFLIDKGNIHIKTDSNFLYTYTTIMANHNNIPIISSTQDLYGKNCPWPPSNSPEGESVKPRLSESIPSGLPPRGDGRGGQGQGQAPLGGMVGVTIQTYYETMWIERGIPIKYLQIALPRNGQLTEPDVEIPTDDYRSYKRNRRSPKTTAK